MITPGFLTTLLQLLIFGIATGQNFTYPVIKKNAVSAEGSVPQGWTILKSASGDLNNDKLDDIALVLQQKDSIIEIRHEEDYLPGYNDTLIYQPRILVIAFYNSGTRQFDKVEQ